MRQALQAAFITVVAIVFFAACNATPPTREDVRSTQEALLTIGAPCISTTQCNAGLICVDGVCCSDPDGHCGSGARDNWTCSNIYGPVPALVAAGGPGHCVQLSPGDPCGALVTLNPCAWKGSTLTNGDNCPAPSGAAATACYPCADSSSCGGGLAVCNSGACVPCSTDNGTGSASQCPFGANPACVNGACVQCSSNNTSACSGSCDTTLHTCAGCNGDYGREDVTRPCRTADRPKCINPGDNGACVECYSDGHCSGATPYCKLSTHTCVACTDSTQCLDQTPHKPVCSIGNECTTCNGDYGAANVTAACPTSSLPVCIAGACKQCSDGKTSECTGATPYCHVASNTCVGCLSNANCGGATPFCDPQSHQCIATCTEDSQCTNPAKPICYKEQGKCVQCTQANAGLCTGATPYCSDKVGTEFTCVGCLTYANCGGTTPVCSDGMVCVACNSDFDKSGNACPTSAAPACAASGACYECVDNTQCENHQGKNVCDTAIHKCVECTATYPAACVGNKPVCNAANDTCVACNGDYGSNATFACRSSDKPACVGGSCVTCSATNTSHCPAALPACDTGTSTCVECTSDAQCTGTKAICNTDSHTCTTGCNDDTNCTDPTPHCKTASHLCVACLSDGQCGGTVPKCNLTSNTCVECLSNSHCSGSTPICSGGTCVPCDGDRDTGTPHQCTSPSAPACVKSGPDVGKCVQCTTGNLELCSGATPACHATTHTCVQCTSDAQCSGSTPICNAAGTCVGCTGDRASNATYTCPTEAKPACLTVGSFSGTCVECNAANWTACSGGKPVCFVPGSMCVECVNDSQCGGLNGKCNTVTHACTLGCTTDANCTSPAAPACKHPDGLCVECTATNTSACVGTKPICDVPAARCVQCTKSAECPSATPVCDPQTKTCVATCTDNSQCPSTIPVCDPVTKTCVECTNNSNCTPPNPICNTTTHTCGTECSKSSECPGDAPVCDPQTKKCVQCTDNSNCTPQNPICNTTTHTCGTECSKSSECPGDVPICDPQTKNCVECQSDVDCPPQDPICNPTSKRCEPKPEPFSIEGGGCACSTVPSRGESTLSVLVGLGLALSAVARRRR